VQAQAPELVPAEGLAVIPVPSSEPAYAKESLPAARGELSAAVSAHFSKFAVIHQ
jgi:hypothetical protein